MLVLYPEIKPYARHELAVAGISHSIDPMGSFKHKMKAIVGIFKPTRRPNVSTASIAEP